MCTYMSLLLECNFSEGLFSMNNFDKCSWKIANWLLAQTAADFLG